MKDGKYVLGWMKPSREERGERPGALNKMLPPNVTVTSAGLGIRDLMAGQISAALSRIEEVAAELASRNVDVISMGGTPPVVVGGYGFDAKIIERINRVTPIPATTSQTNADQAMRLFGAKKIVLVTPFRDDINRAIIKYLEDSGFQISCLKTANAPFEEFPKIPASVPYDLALEGVKEAPDAECLFIPCAAWPIGEIIEPLEKETGLPVIASTQAQVWGALRLIGIKTTIQGFGRLLREF
jgi:maleate cis-trans isomerase